jgi:DNA-binding GntR family transcriptional regulator
MSEPSLSAAERAYHDIRAAIATGELASGTMVSENDLAARIGVSRTPVRAALLRLQDEGWITVYPQRGALIREISPDEARNIADARHTLEFASVRHLADGARAALVMALTAIIDQQSEQLQSSTFDSFVDLDIDFHRSLVAAGRNPLIVEFYDRLRDRQSLMIARRVSATPRQAEDILREHRQLVQHISQGKWDELDAALRTHLLATHSAALDEDTPSAAAT